MSLPPVAWTLDGQSVELDDWSASARANGGFDQARGRTPSRNVSSADQGSRLIAWLPSGRVLWSGRLAAPPHVVGGVAVLSAQGDQVLARKDSRRVLFATRDYGLWVDASSPPLSRTAQASLKGTVQPNHLAFEVMQASVAQNDAYPLQLWAQGALLRRVAFTIDRSADTTDYKIRVQTATGAGTTTLVADYPLGSGDAKTIDVTVASPGDSLIISLVRTGATTTTASRLVVRITNLRVGDAELTDGLPGSAAVDHVAGLLGLNRDAITSSTSNVLPLDWLQGDLAGLLDHVADIDDYRWLVLADANGPRMDYGPWEREWAIDALGGRWEDMAPVEVFNQVRVRYQTAAGTPAELTVAADPDPLSASGITNVYEHALSGDQPNDILARYVANTLIARVSARRYTGRVVVADASDAAGRGPMEILPGDLAVLRDFRPGENVTQRIHEVSYGPEGVTLGIESGVSISGLLAALAAGALRNPTHLPAAIVGTGEF